MVGLCAHESAMGGGKRVVIPTFDAGSGVVPARSLGLRARTALLAGFLTRMSMKTFGRMSP